MTRVITLEPSVCAGDSGLALRTYITHMNSQRLLKRLHLQSPQASALAHFYANNFGMTCQETHGVWFCRQQGREVLISQGHAGKLHYALFVIHHQAEWDVFTTQTSHLTPANLEAHPELPTSALGFCDPDENCMVFVLASDLDMTTQTPEQQVHSATYRLPKPSTLRFALNRLKL